MITGISHPLQPRLILVSIALLIMGLGLVAYSMTYPVYTDSNAPERLSNQLEKLPREIRFKQWYIQLAAYETPHKRFSDLGRGLAATGMAILLATGLWNLYHRESWMHSLWVIFALWLGLWAIRIPFTMWYYWLRENRFDYPVWGDSIGIPVIEESASWIIGAIVSSIVLGLLLIRHPLPAQIQFCRPISPLDWCRAIFLYLWLALLVVCVTAAIPEGDEGMIISCILASPILLVVLAARKA